MTAFPFDRNKISEICRKNDVAMIGVSCSIARVEGNEKSDIDMLVKFAKKKSLLALVTLERELSSALGKKVDLLTEAAISLYLRNRILRDFKVIYEAG